MIASAKIAAYLELGKLRLSSMAVFAVLAGLCLGSPDLPEWGLVISTLGGTILVAIGGSALNMYLERDLDPVMERTEDRPRTARCTPPDHRDPTRRAVSRDSPRTRAAHPRCRGQTRFP